MNPRNIKIKISKTLQAKIARGFPWVYYYQIRNKIASGRPGDLGVIYGSDNRFLAVGLYDPTSDIRLRVLQTRTPREIDAAFFRERLERAATVRAELEAQGTTGYRWVNGENDGFPGLVIDRYADTLVLKVYTAAWFPFLETVVAEVRDLWHPKRLVLLLSRHVERVRPDGYRNGQILFGPELTAPVRFQENGLWFEADVLEGQKTGFFLDQRDNRKRVGEMARDCSVLNVFSYTGGFSVYAFAGGCRSVTEIDINGIAQNAARVNLRLNFDETQVPAERFVQLRGDAFKLLRELDTEGRVFDLVILDPPAFANSKKNKPNALQAYIRLAKAGARRTRTGGILFAASCSSQVSADEFYRAVDLGIRQTGRSHRKLLKTRHAVDHPVTFREGAYLKAVFCQLTS